MSYVGSFTVGAYQKPKGWPQQSKIKRCEHVWLLRWKTSTKNKLLWSKQNLLPQHWSYPEPINFISYEVSGLTSLFKNKLLTAALPLLLHFTSNLWLVWNSLFPGVRLKVLVMDFYFTEVHTPVQFFQRKRKHKHTYSNWQKITKN